MPIRARVGRHTRSGGGHCQNWADDQKVIIDLLNSIPRTSGGTQGSLNPRIVAGICSNELYAAISAFEDKYWPGQRSGYIDPGGAMYQKLALLAAPAVSPPAAAPPPPPPPAPPPTTGTIPRPLTAGETVLLRSVFADTLSYGDQYVGRNDGEVGGPWNSYTPGYLPNMAVRLWSWDYSRESPVDAAVFVHEMVHVWQSGHGSHNALRGIYLWLKYDHVWRDYDDSYVYDLDSSISLSDFNMEQQAQIIQDYYRVLKGLDVESRSSDPGQKYNSGTRKSLSDYQPYVSQLQSAGPFQGVGAGADGTAARERIMRRAWGRNAP
jgi:hypothetical protein